MSGCPRWDTYTGKQCIREDGHGDYHVTEHDGKNCDEWNGYVNIDGFNQHEHVCPEWPHAIEVQP